MRMMVLAAALLVCACGQATNHASAQGAGGAGASGAAETQEQFVARCTRETIAQNPQAQSWAQGNCEQIWEKVAAAGPLAEMILAAAPATAAPAGLSATCAQLAMVRWSGGASGATLATGKLGADLDIAVQRAPPSLAISWSGGGDIVPYDIVEALRGRGATLAVVACQSFGTGDNIIVYNVSAPAHAPFGLQVYAHDAAMAGAHAPFNVTLDLSGQPATLARQRTATPNEEWVPACG
jgi:hypothetical protein